MWYEFSQNNSGGEFIRNNDSALCVLVEANSAEEANKRATRELGIYFNGCNAGMDCPCCGDRWYPVTEYDAKTEPSVYLFRPERLGGPLETTDMQLVANEEIFGEVGKPGVIVLPLEGKKQVFITEETDD